MTRPPPALLKQVLLARARMMLAGLPDQMATEIMALPAPRSPAAIERRMMEMIEAKLGEMEATPPSAAELGGTIH